MYAYYWTQCISKDEEVCYIGIIDKGIKYVSHPLGNVRVNLPIVPRFLDAKFAVESRLSEKGGSREETRDPNEWKTLLSR